MYFPDSFKISLPTDCEILIQRDFHAPLQLVFEASTKPELVRMGGVFREVVAPARLVATEKFEDSWYAGEALDTTVFVEAGDITKLELTVLYESKEARDTASKSGMERGMVAGYNRLEEMLISLGDGA